ncbi:hypothetical protein Adt_16937 [Abeliophyllum distichum]|uniref:Uncharacterized protein n=1 Tax=Abeliophyllum distichum TaxID=126358 RepID=A0ABD1TF30_9LAMI
MSLPNEDQNSQDNVLEKLHQVQKKTKILYTREFLLSLSDLDICKKLPSGFDESILSEFEDALQSLQDRPRNPGSFPLQGFRRNEYGSSPPTRGDSSNYSRGTYGRWESRSFGRSDLDSDSQSDKDSDSGRRYGHQSRRSWQTPEHDGLLGSGSFPRPSGYASGISAAKVRANENYQLSKKNEPYQPPRPYKAMPHSRKETDSFNDETFGSMEYTSEDRAEEEKRRRDSFELMRKEQQKSLQEKQKLSLEKHKAGNASDLSEFLEGSKEEKGLLGGYNELDVSTATPVLNNESDKSSFSSHAARPPVPPGFTNNNLEKSSGTKSLIPPPLAEIGKPVAEERLLYFRANPVQNGNLDGLEKQLSKEITSVDGQTEDKSKRVPFLNMEVNSHSRLGVPNEKVSVEDQCDPTSLSDDHGILNDSEIIELNAKELEDKVVGKSKKNYSSFLENKFGSALTMNDGGDTVDSAKHHNGKVHDTWSPKSTQSSKFAQWFFEEEAQPAIDISSGRAE